MIKNWHERFDLENINSIDLPPEVSNMVPLAERLNPYAKVNAWRTYLDQQTRTNSENRSVERRVAKALLERQFNEDIDDDTWSYEHALPAGKIKKHP
ncbi:unnamed protein product [Rotaria sp. Silwood2]|nr:unnamed protein product [Rotaria sp. Silwood2]CAF4477445.1 unnamed protein product [Rotaria sp. Silwood2]